MALGFPYARYADIRSLRLLPCYAELAFYFYFFLYSSRNRRACGQGAVLSLCMVRPGSGRFGVGFWVGFWVGLRARDFPTERVLSRTPLIIRTTREM